MTMRLDQFPRPRGDTGIGFVYSADPADGDRQSLAYWLAELQELGASWLVLPSTLDRPVPEFVVRELIRAHVEPVIQIDVWPLRPVDRASLLAVCRQYAEWGVYYVQVYREPNLASQWRFEDWTLPGLVERFVAMLFPALETILAAGLIPLLSSLAPGGSYWDLSFLRQLLEILARDGRPRLVDQLGMAIHLDPGNRPLSWGKGGPDRWPLARPYDCPGGSQDHLGFNLFEWYDRIIRDRLGQSLPLICGETNLIVGTRSDPAFPPLDEMTQAQRCVDIARALMASELPDYLFNVAFATLTPGKSDPADVRAWYKHDTSALPVVEAMKRLKKQPRSFHWDPRPAADSHDGSRRRIYHYLLFESGPAAPTGGSLPRWMLPAALDYVTHFQPTVGFSAEEARQASRVTLVGTDHQAMASTAASLANAGCLTELIVATSDEELRRTLSELIRRGRRFRQLPG